jgi:hypothetical protein
MRGSWPRHVKKICNEGPRAAPERHPGDPYWGVSLGATSLHIIFNMTCMASLEALVLLKDFHSRRQIVKGVERGRANGAGNRVNLWILSAIPKSRHLCSWEYPINRFGRSMKCMMMVYLIRHPPNPY